MAEALLRFQPEEWSLPSYLKVVPLDIWRVIIRFTGLSVEYFSSAHQQTAACKFFYNLVWDLRNGCEISELYHKSVLPGFQSKVISGSIGSFAVWAYADQITIEDCIEILNFLDTCPFPNLRRVDLRHIKVGWSMPDFSFLTNLAKLEELCFSISTGSTSTWNPASLLAGVASPFDTICKLTQLQKFTYNISTWVRPSTVYYTDVGAFQDAVRAHTRRSVPRLVALTNLVELDLSQLQCSARAPDDPGVLDMLSSLSKLTSLGIGWGENVDSIDIKAISTLSRLKTLRLDLSCPVTHLVAHLTGLETLSIHHRGDAGLASLTTLGNLTSLTWTYGSDSSLEPGVIRSFSKLKSLTLRGSLIQPRDIHALAASLSLERLDFSTMKAEADQLMELVPLQLKFLGFSHKTSTYEEIKALAYKLNCCDIRVSNGQTLLHLAVANSDVATVSKLLDAISSQKSSHVFVDYPDWNGRTPIGIAVQNNHEEIVDILLAFGADIDGAQHSGLSLWQLAESAGNLKMAMKFLAASRAVAHVIDTEALGNLFGDASL